MAADVQDVAVSSGPVVCVTRKAHFSAAHYLRSVYLSESENRDLYGKCYNTHGHNYTVEATVKGKVDQRTGMVLNITELAQAMEAVVKQLDHKHIDSDVPYFRDRVVSTTENLTVFIWSELEQALRHSTASLVEVLVHETEKNKFSYRGE